jgi:hypothetical protein
MHDPILGSALANIAATFRARIISACLTLKRESAENRCEAAGLAVGKFCEVVLRQLQDRVLGSYTPLGVKISNFADDCRKLVAAPATAATESERTIIPRALVFMYTIRNKRGIGHVGGDVDANQIDSAVMSRIADWVVCELIRIHHGLSLEEAQDLVDSLSVRQLPLVWEVAGKKRVLKDGLRASDEVLVLLYSSKESAVLVEDLCDWVEYSNRAAFKNQVLGALHKARLIELDRDSDAVTLSPKGAEVVEKELI